MMNRGILLAIRRDRAIRCEHKPERQPACQHSPDFRSVLWFGQTFYFTAGQAAIVRILWECWENGTPEVSQAYLLEHSGSVSSRIAPLFQDSPAWGTMIQPGTKGAWRLVKPPTLLAKAAAS